MYMRIRRHFFHDSGYLTRHFSHIAVKDKYLPDRVFISEIFAGNPFRDHNLARHGKTRGAVAFQQFKIKQTEETRISVCYLILTQTQFTIFYQLLRLDNTSHTGIILNSRQIFLHGRTISK